MLNKSEVVARLMRGEPLVVAPGPRALFSNGDECDMELFAEMKVKGDIRPIKRDNGVVEFYEDIIIYEA